MKRNSGYTLVELLLVVSIIAIFASLILPRLQGHPEYGRVAEAMTFLNALRKGEMAYFNEHGQYLNMWPVGTGTPQQWEQLGLQQPVGGQFYWNYGAISFNFGGGGPLLFVTAQRRNVQAAPADVNQWLFLDANGTWGGTGNYAPGQRYGPKK